MYSTGTKLTVKESTVNSSNQTWYKVQIDGTSTVGYIISDYVTIIKESGDNSIPEGELVTVTNIGSSGYTVTVKATDDKGVSEVLFSTVAGSVTKKVNGTSIGNSQYQSTISTSQFASSNQQYTTTVTAVDSSGNTNVIATVTINPATYKPITVTYNLNGGTGSIVNSSADFFGNVTLSSETPKNNGLYFLGWSDSMNGTVKYVSGGKYQFEKNTQLFAVWNGKLNGDCNGDGKADTTDLSIMKLYLCGSLKEIGENSDINSDGVIDTTDIALLKLFLAGA